MKLKEAMKLAKQTGKRVQVTEPTEYRLKVPLNMRIDGDVVEALKIEAEKAGVPYQTHINSILKTHISAPSLEERVRAIEKKLKIG